MSDPVFIQHSRVGRGIFAIEGVCLEITRRFLGKKQVHLVPLHSLSPRYVRKQVRVWPIILLPLLIAFVSGSIAVYASQSKEEAFQYGAIWLGMVCVIFTIQALLGVPKVDLAWFYKRNGQPAFFIVRTKKQAQDFDEFVAALVSSIEVRSGSISNKENLPNQPPLRMPVSGTPAADAPVAPPPGTAGR